MKYKDNLYRLILFFLIVACIKEKNISSAEIVDLIHQDALSIAQAPEINDSVELVYRPTNIETASFEEETNIVTNTNAIILVSDPVLEEKASAVKSTQKIPIPLKKVIPKKVDNFLKPGSYIKIGNDTPGQTVSPRSARKITSVVITSGRSVYMDIYLYAIPKNQSLVRNANTLIGFVKDLDVVNNQVQFTKFWDARLVQGRFLTPGEYNIYMFYIYKDKNKKEILSSGRFWGGDHRRWFIKVL
ncbi:hypothetical protein SAMN02745150_01236 [Brevinema andersonii]|uniref:Uncharacterized protein n=1 Tax=Brevinema andersonii TaxID=34097 RepID=A0A1I1ET33_BREAD|nr:hypothetical protein [Brevinema andersonii]SFB89862.1 hypothetical protein SAMN02745150_01236 [Brevinema andersonii]